MWLTARRGISGLEVAEPACHLLSIGNAADFPIDLSRITRILGENGVGIIPLCSYGGDHLLIKDAHLEKAAGALSGAGYRVNGMPG